MECKVCNIAIGAARIETARVKSRETVKVCRQFPTGQKDTGKGSCVLARQMHRKQMGLKVESHFH